ncbi:2-oxo acid dehydrogenase subunit E2 [Iodidimonas sp. SYSU 1G8]|uniref:2-oxo acid dehydrogenase subunit E2 n=1 Tax=Iodidimonas sp. SYSU 1G8 TaxID=3133967 RepID=UPI0031FEE711
MAISITMPALSPTMEEGNLSKWRVKEGDRVKSGDIIAEIETDKATMEVEAVDDGVVGKLMVAEGTEGVKVNSVIAMLLEEGEDAADLKAPARSPAKKDAGPKVDAEATAESAEHGDLLVNPAARRLAEEQGIDLSGVKGTGPHGRITKGDVVALSGEGGKPKAKTPSPEPSKAKGGRVFASPVARRIAADKGFTLSDIPGSGPDGRIVKADVEAFTPAAASSIVQQPRPADVQGDTPYEEVRLSTMRKTIARRMTEAKQTVPHFYLTIEVEIDKLLDIRKDLNDAGEGPKVSVNDFIIRAAGLALKQFPDANVQFAGDKLRRFSRSDVAVAVAIEGGLITPIVKGADLKGVAAISSEMKELAGRAKDGKLAPEEYQGGTIAISNLGMFGVKEFLAVINPPQASILAIGAGEKRPVVRNDQLAIATLMSVTMACDHRAMDGAVGAQFLQVFKTLLEHPVRLLI